MDGCRVEDQSIVLDPDSVCDVLHAAQDAAGVRRFGLHGLRYLYASLLIESGANIKFAQAKLGHATSAMTLDVYSRVITDQGRECAEKVAEKFPFVSLTLAEGAADGEKWEPVN